MDISYSIVRSFTDIDPTSGTQVGGNAAAVIFMDRDQFSDADQVEIAGKFPTLTEAVFVYPCDGNNADFGMRYWSPQRLCEYSITGHPTIAAAFAMLQYGHPCLIPSKEKYTLETKAGSVPLRFDRTSNKVYMGQIEPVYTEIPAEMEQEIHDIFGLSRGDIVTPIKAVNMGLGYFIFKVRDLATLMNMKRDLPRLITANAKFGLNGGAQPYADSIDTTYDLRTRNLDLRPYDANGNWAEDSACGQGSASLMAYLIKYHDHLGTSVKMQQGVLSEPCCVETSAERIGDTSIIFIGGSAIEDQHGVLEY